MAVLGRLLYRRPIFNGRSRPPTVQAAHFQWPFSAAYRIGGPYSMPFSAAYRIGGSFSMAVLGRLPYRRPKFNGRPQPPTV